MKVVSGYGKCYQWNKQGDMTEYNWRSPHFSYEVGESPLGRWKDPERLKDKKELAMWRARERTFQPSTKVLRQEGACWFQEQRGGQWQGKLFARGGEIQSMIWEIGRRSDHRGHADYSKEFRFYFKCKGKPLDNFKQEMRWPGLFFKEHSGCFRENWWEGDGERKMGRALGEHYGSWGRGHWWQELE